MSGSSQQFCIRWNSHLGSLGAAFPQMLAGQRFVDVTLACEGHQVHCHRLVLAACSSYFEALLGENPCKHPIIILPRDIKLWEIQALVDFMYKGEVNVSQAGLGDLIKCAEMLQIRGLCGADAALNLNTIATEHKDNAKRNDAKDPDGNDAPKTQTTASTNDSIQMKIDPDSRENTPETTRLTTDSDLPQTQDVTVNKNKSDFALANVTCEYDSHDDEGSNGAGFGGATRRIRRSETILAQAADCVSRGQTFQTVSNMFHIPISTIRFFMARKGILPRRKRGRAANGDGGRQNSSGSRSRAISEEPPFHFVNFKLPKIRPKL
ncbi:protein bric-a-brac 1 isoform X2 [Phlebotomus papatasi]|uniref:protein bric-a-brac 1 isoform X2 n=1 Tax=Phlebotomus papatasi TaxID=29031 RepID=UPI002483A574|nr:protein bric-a-brac 1 isoform X2 [Phlebotomus papatasi]